ncbi:MAG: MutS-related protein, partial [Steroidobacteraceae bacterium]
MDGSQPTSQLHAEQYRRRLHALEAQLARLDVLAGRISNVRIVLAIIAVASVWWSAQSTTSPAYVWLVPVALFVAAVIYHSRIRRARARTDRAAAHYRVGLARIEDCWSGLGNPGTELDDAHHVYSADLDLFGHGNLFELLSTARTRMGERTLAGWLLSPAPTATVLQRQQSIAELRDRLDFREGLAVLGETAEVGVRPEELLRWAESPNQLTQRWILPTALLLPALLIAALVYWNVSGMASPFVVILLLELGAVRLLRRRLTEVLGSTEQAFDRLRLLADLATRLEREPLDSALSKQLLVRLSSAGVAASRAIARLATIVQFIESRRNFIIQVLDLPLLYSVHTALAAERWRSDHGLAVGAWLDAIGEFEALISLSAYSYEHPDDPFPELAEGDASFVASALGHPLLPRATCVCNDVTIAGATRVLLISGSNMSGKSTLLRTVGINTVLAMAGAPVRARRLRLSPLQVGTNIRINDSLHEGSSRFYAEITRLRHLNELAAREPPLPQLLFLLDEVLQGTNSRDRFIGAQGVIGALIGRGAIGLVTTHDLALT